MCRMIAKASLAPTGIIDELEKCPHSLYWLSANGKKSDIPGSRGKHQDGCGLAYVQGSEIILHKRGQEQFWDESFHAAASVAKSTLFIAHDRDASTGLNHSESGAHPFTTSKNGAEVAFCHNGTVYTMIEEAQGQGTADTYIYLYKLLENADNLSPDSIAASVKNIADTNEFSSITAFLLTNDRLFAWRYYNEKREEKQGEYEVYYTLYMSLRPGNILIASEPLDDARDWLLLPNRSFVSIKPAIDHFEIDYRIL